MLPQPNWPEGHADKANRLLADLEADSNLLITKIGWSTGIVIVTRKH